MPRRRRPSTKLADRRLRILLVLFAVVFAVTLARAAWLQTVQASSLSSKGASQQRETLVVPAGRGTIFDRAGVQLAIGEQATTVYANPREIVNARKVADAAAETLGVDASSLYPQLVDRSKGFVYVAREADADKAAALKRRHLAGLGFYAGRAPRHTRSARSRRRWSVSPGSTTRASRAWSSSATARSQGVPVARR